jgi:DNA polymerase elongation subunit (family B)
LSYVDAYHCTKTEKIHVVERTNGGERVFRVYPAEYIAYYPDQKGKYTSIFGDQLEKIQCNTRTDFKRELGRIGNNRIFERDIKPISRCLETNYKGIDAPTLFTAFFDIETGFCKERGFAPPEDPFNPITAITVYLNWLDKLVTVAIPPPTLNIGEANELCKEYSDTYLFTNEIEMLNVFLELIKDADVVSGWNSETFDIPYTVNRIIRTMSKNDTRRFCLWDQLPKKREFERYGNNNETYDLTGRVHLDYMQLYIKYNYEERHSYSLDAIGEYEIGERKVPYEGSLDQLYNNDFKKFIAYSRQDVALLDKLDKKLKFISLANEIAHENTVLLPQTMGAVAVTEQAIINEAHNRNLIVHSRVRTNHGDEPEEKEKVAGAYVARPLKGISRWVASIDLNSLYPSVFRALNMAPETIVGQIRQDITEKMIQERLTKVKGQRKKSFADAWEGKFSSWEYDLVIERDRATKLTIDWETGESSVMTGAEIYNLVFSPDSKLILSANGTFFTTEKVGVIPGLLERWYSERKKLQAVLKQWEQLQVGIEIPERLR